MYEQLTKYGSPVSLPSLQQIEEHLRPKALIASTPLPPPPPQGLWTKTTEWVSRNKHAIETGVILTVIGLKVGIFWRRGDIWLPVLGRNEPIARRAIESGHRLSHRKPLISKNGTRTEAVVVLGVDTPLGRALALHLSSIGFIVIASVSSHAALSAFNSLIPPSSRGYIKALIYETSDVGGSLGKFIRSVDEVLKLRFPLLSAGDPYAAPGDQVDLVGAVNALSYVPPTGDIGVGVSASLSSRPSRPASFQSNAPELADALEKHVVAALCALTALEPLLSSVPRRARRERGGDPGQDDEGAGAATASRVYPATVITLLSSPSSHTSLPGAGKESVIAQATAAGMETMRREADDASSKERFASSHGGNFFTRPVSSRRPVRVTTIEVDGGLPWGHAAVAPVFESGDVGAQGSATSSSSTASTFNLSTAGTSGTGSATVTPRPSALLRKASSAYGNGNNHNSWATRDASTQVVLNRVSSLLLPVNPDKRPRATYHVYLPTDSERGVMGQACSLFNRGTQRLMRVLPTGCVDVLLAMRRQVSLRRAGLIAQGPRPARSASSGSASGGGGGTASNSQVVQAAQTPTNSRTTATSASSQHLANPPRHREASLSSAPSSNSGDSGSHADVDSEDGMISSGVLSSNEGGAGRRYEHDDEDAGPWVGPASRESPRVDAHGGDDPMGASGLSAASAATQTDSTGVSVSVSDSWVDVDEQGG